MSDSDSYSDNDFETAFSQGYETADELPDDLFFESNITLIEQFKTYFMEHSFNLIPLNSYIEKQRQQQRAKNKNTEATKIKIVKDLISKTCAGNIGLDYINSLTKAVIKNSNKYDMIVCRNSDNSICHGFLIVQKGECSTYPDNYCVNLICANPTKLTTIQHTDVGVGACLISLYLYIIINDATIDDTNKIGLLELANSYYNPSGLCLYTKFGFKYDNTLSKPNCFPEQPANLPMIAILSQYGTTTDEQNTTLFNILNNAELKYTKPEICLLKGQVQQLYGMAENILFAKKTTGNIRDLNVSISDGTFLNYEQMSTDYPTENDIQRLMTTIKTAKLDIIDTLFNKYITPPATIINTIKRTTRSSARVIGGKHKSRKHKSRKHKSRKHKSRKKNILLK